jgi:hypothetical protein
VTLELNADKPAGPPPNGKEPIGTGKGDYELVTKGESEINELKAGIQVYYINEGKSPRCPEIQIKIAKNIYINAIIDSGSEISLLAERVYDKLINGGASIPILPVENVILVTAFGKRTRKIKSQVLMEFAMGDDQFEVVFLLSPELTNEAILGCEFLKEYGLSLDFRKGDVCYEKEGKWRCHSFIPVADEGSVCASTLNISCDPTRPSQRPLSPAGSTDPIFPHTYSPVTGRAGGPKMLGHTSASDRCQVLTIRRSQNKEGIIDDIRAIEPALIGAKSDQSNDEEVAEVLAVSSRNCAKVKGQGAHFQRELKIKRIGQGLPNRTENYDYDPNDADRKTRHTAELWALIEQNKNLKGCEKRELFETLRKYIDHFSAKPGKCNMFEYKFEVVASQPMVSYSRAIPFSIRPEVRLQINEMLSDGILETSNSPILNPLTIVHREGKKIRLCVDARKVNQHTIPDYERTPPLQELLQRFEGAQYMTSIDLSSAYWQIPLHKDSRKYTAFLFDSTVYQFTRVPYGFRNSLSAFVRALKLTLGGGLEEFVVHYIDDLLIHSKTFEEHVKHLHIVLSKLTRAGFTLNSKKCKFCCNEIKFLGHRIDKLGVSADPDRVEAILNYPVPRNSKQLRQFLGTCNFHSRFVVSYAEYTAPLLPLLRKDMKWEWTKEKQEAFLKLRESFAQSIHLVHPRNDRPYAIYTDASRLGLSATLTQESETGGTLIVSTASRVLSPIEQKYSTCEQELLAVVYALKKFRIYVVGHPITVYTDNKALSFLRKCNLTSNRVTRWIMQLQEYNLNVIHISGANNFLADALSRNPTGLREEDRGLVRKPREILIAKIDLLVDKNLKKELDNLDQHQSSDPKLRELRTRLERDPATVNDRYLLKNDILYSKNDKAHPYWRAILPRNLEYRVIEYVHTLLGHQGTDKCVHQIAHSFVLKNLGRKVRKYVSQCDTCQRVKHPNRAYEIGSSSHLPAAPGELVTIDLYGPLPAGRGGVKNVLVCLEVFTKHVKLYPLKAATTRSCLSKLRNHYFQEVIKPKVILSDHGSQFTSPSWKRALSDLDILTRYTPIRHPASNPTERIMRELGKYFRIYCQHTQKKWPELIPYIEDWLNKSVSTATGFAPTELLIGGPPHDVFDKLLKKEQDQKPEEVALEEKLSRAYIKMKTRARKMQAKRKTGRTVWRPNLGDDVLVKCQPVSDAAQGITAKFQPTYEGPYYIKKFIPPAMYEVHDTTGKLRGLFNLKHLKPYLQPIPGGLL